MTDQMRAITALRQSEQIYRGIGESLDFGIWTCDAKGRNVYASESFLKLIGITQEQCAGFNWANALHPDDAADTSAAWKECVRTGSKWERVHRYLGVDGRYHPILARGVAIRNERGEIAHWAGINLDIGEIKETEQQLRDAVTARDEFLSIAAHELKTPLTALHLQLQLMGRIASKENAGSKLATLSSGALQASNQLVRLLDELLDVTKIRVSKLALEKHEVDLRAAVIEGVSAVAEEARQIGSVISINGDQPVVGYWDPARINQIVANLLSNAIKYGEGKPIEITVEADQAHARLLVLDRGMGIPLEKQPVIFERFERATGPQISGLGLGLYIVRQIVEAHGGLIAVDSELGKGALFIVELPLSEREEAT
jgi:PAS domain S-box-containing protein